MMVVSSLALFISCRPQKISHQNQEAETQLVVEEIRHNCPPMPGDTTAEAYNDLHSSVHEFYASSDYQRLWTEHQGLTPKATALLAVIRSARLYGLLPQDYHLAEIDSARSESDCTSLLRVEALLTDAFFSMTSHIRDGKLQPVTTDPAQFIALQDLGTAEEIRNYLKTVEPAHAGYRHLRSALTNLYDTMDTQDREALLAGATSDTIASQSTIKAIEINLERWRGEKKPFGPDYVFVNIPAYEVTVFRNDSLMLQSRAIVGKPATPTPVFSSAIECFIVYPFWHVPRSIAVGEYLPAIRKDTSFLSLNNFDVLDRKGNILRYDTLEWDKFSKDYFPVTLRQREGNENALGIVKFHFENPYAVFLHDTNAKRLFQREKRALSHGCIRMEKAVDFAHYLSQAYTGRYTPEMIDRYIRLKEKHTIDLEKALPVHIRYFTVDSDGIALRQFEDVYRKDKALYERMYPASPGR